MRKTMLMAAAVTLMSAGTVLAADSWLHVRVDSRDEGEQVRVNVPLSLVEAVLPLIDEEDIELNGRIRLDGADLEIEEVVAFLKAVRDAEDGVYVTIEDRDDTVRVAKEGKYLLVDVPEGRSRPETVRVRIPIRVLDALVSGKSGELDIMAGIRALGEEGEGEIVAVSEDDSEVRVWVDQKSDSD
jgi:hypothetical protein